MTRVRAVVAGLMGVAVLAGCGLPLDSGVRSPGQVTGDTVEPAGIQVLPPGPQPDAGPRGTVLGFLGAQSNPDDRHAIAREFLHPELRETWNDTSSVDIYEPGSLETTPDPLDEARVVVRYRVLARIADDGAYLLDPSGVEEEEYRLRRDEAGQLRLAEVPPGLLLTPRDAGRSFRPYEVYFPRSGNIGEPAPLVPDRVFVPVGADPVDALVRRLLAGPSAPLGDAVASALPAGTELRRPVSTVDGVVTVDLTSTALQADARQRQRLSAQLVWTLRGAGQLFTSLRLLVDGQPLRVDDVGAVQDRTDWAAYDPAGPAAERASALFVRDRSVESLQGPTRRSEATDGRLPVDSAVASPTSGELALLTRRTDAADEVRTGPPSGPFPLRLTRPRITSLSWGGGRQGLWVVAAGGAGPEPEVLLLPDDATGPPVTVPYVRPSGAGPLSLLRISRDGARAAVVFGAGEDRRLHVGRVERRPDGVRLEGLRAVAPTLTDVADVAWETGTALVALARLDTTTRLPVRVAVDGSELEPVRTLGLTGEPETLTATGGRPLVVGADLDGRPVLFVQESELFRLLDGTGTDPSYPG